MKLPGKKPPKLVPVLPFPPDVWRRFAKHYRAKMKMFCGENADAAVALFVGHYGAARRSPGEWRAMDRFYDLFPRQAHALTSFLMTSVNQKMKTGEFLLRAHSWKFMEGGLKDGAVSGLSAQFERVRQRAAEADAKFIKENPDIRESVTLRIFSVFEELKATDRKELKYRSEMVMKKCLVGLLVE